MGKKITIFPRFKHDFEIHGYLHKNYWDFTTWLMKFLGPL